MQLTTLSNGLRVVSRKTPAVETVAIGLFAEVGSRNESARVNGIAHLFEHMVFKGAGGRSAREISEAIEDVGGDLNACTERDGTSFTQACWPSIWAWESRSSPISSSHRTSTPRDLEREKQVVLSGTRRGTRHAQRHHLRPSVGSGLFRPAAGPLDPWLTRTSIEAITLDDLRTWRDHHYRGNNLILSAAGKVDHDALVDLAEHHFGDLEAASRRRSEPAQFHQRRPLDRSASRPGPSRHRACPRLAASTPEYLPARLFADIVGGGMSSRLFQELREERGLAYSV